MEQKQHLLLAYWTVREEYRRMGRAMAREEELREVRNKPEEGDGKREKL